jgi:hypothetical protein
LSPANTINKGNTWSFFFVSTHRTVPINLNFFFCNSLLSTSSYIGIFLNCGKTLTSQTKFLLCSWLN